MKKMHRNMDRNIIGLLAIIGAVSFLSGCGAGASKASETMAGSPMEAAPMAAETTGTALHDNEENGVVSNYQRAYESAEFNTEEYNAIIESGFQSVANNPLSTFSADVDTAAYSNIRRMIESGTRIPEDAVRIEEMINYFSYDYEAPSQRESSLWENSLWEPLAVTTELSDCPWNPESQLLLIGIKAEEIDFDNRPMSNLVFLLDVSGSMSSEDKLPLVQKSFAMLTEELTENDRVSIVTYAGYDEVVLEGARGDEKSRITDALMSLSAGGSTAGSEGIVTAYELAQAYFIPGGNNRVILATDGDLNVGITSEGDLKRLISKKRDTGVHLSVLGFGTDNIKDNKMVALADNGNGNYRYIDSVMEAKKVLVEEMGGTLITVAKDVKLQVEFNPAAIKGYRLIGYEKRALADEDFHNDKVDAGEIGCGHNVTVLYELLPVRSDQNVDETDLKYQSQQQENQVDPSELLTVSIRYKAPNGTESKLMSHPVAADTYEEKMPGNLRFAAAVAEFGMVLRDSEWKGSATYESVLDLAVGDVITDDYRKEFVRLVEKARKGN